MIDTFFFEKQFLWVLFSAQKLKSNFETKIGSRFLALNHIFEL